MHPYISLYKPYSQSFSRTSVHARELCLQTNILTQVLYIIDSYIEDKEMERNRIIDWGLGEDLVEEDLTAGEGDVEENVGVGQEFFSHQIIPRPIRH